MDVINKLIASLTTVLCTTGLLTGCIDQGGNATATQDPPPAQQTTKPVEMAKPVQKEVYKWRDENGKLHFSDQVPEHIKQLETIKMTESTQRASSNSTADIIEKNRKWYNEHYKREDAEKAAHQRQARYSSTESKNRDRYLKTQQADYCRASKNYLQRLLSQLDAKKGAGIRVSTENWYNTKIEAQRDIIKKQCKS